jgi:tetratricopeptide (TPR) repeat protein
VLFLRSSQVELRAETTKNPIIVIANDFFLSLRADLLRTKGQQLQIAGLPDETVGHDPVSFQGAPVYRNIDLGYFANPEFRAVLDYCQSSAGSAEFLFPVGVLNCIESLRAISEDKLVLLSTDRIGTATDAEIGQLEQSYVIDGSLFLNRTNYEAINRYNDNQGGLSLCLRDQGSSRAIAMNILVPSEDCGFEQTRYRFREKAEQVCLAIHLREPENIDQDTQGADRASLWAYLSMLHLSNYDPDVFCQRSERLYGLFKEIDDRRIKRLLKEALSRVQDNARAAVQERETYLWLGKIFFRLNLYDKCLEVFNQSIKFMGQDSLSLYYIAACTEIREDYRTALSYYEQALVLDPTRELCTEAIKRMEARVKDELITLATPLAL